MTLIITYCLHSCLWCIQPSVINPLWLIPCPQQLFTAAATTQRGDTINHWPRWTTNHQLCNDYQGPFTISKHHWQPELSFHHQAFYQSLTLIFQPSHSHESWANHEPSIVSITWPSNPPKSPSLDRHPWGSSPPRSPPTRNRRCKPVAGEWNGPMGGSGFRCLSCLGGWELIWLDDGALLMVLIMNDGNPWCWIMLIRCWFMVDGEWLLDVSYQLFEPKFLSSPWIRVINDGWSWSMMVSGGSWWRSSHHGWWWSMMINEHWRLVRGK